MTSDNIIQFPKKTKTIDKNENVLNINDCSLTLTDAMFVELRYLGVDVTKFKEENLMDVAFVIETIKSLMHRYHGTFHPFHSIINKIIEEKDGNYNIKPPEKNANT